MNFKILFFSAATALPGLVSAQEANIISSPEAEAIYGFVYPVIEERYPDLNVMIVTRDMIPGASEAYEEHDFSFYDLCNWPAMTDEMGEAIAVRADLEQAMSNVLFQYSMGEEIFVPEADLMAAMRNDFTTIPTIVSGTVSGAVDGIGTAITLNHYFPEMSGTVGIVTMPASLEDPYVAASGLSGLSSEYIDIQSTGNDHAIHIMGHEIGHLLNRDGGANAPEDDSYCSSVNIGAIDYSVRGEVGADVEGSEFFDMAESHGLTSGADTSREIGHLRSIGTLMHPSNSFIVASGEDMILHLTNTGFDPSQADFREAFDYSSLDGVSVLPLLINNFADTMAGYAIALRKKEMIGQIPSFFSEEDREFYGELPEDAANIIDHVPSLAWVGYNERIWEEDPSYHYAAIRYMHENGIIDDIREALRPGYGSAVDDMVTDYLDGIAAVAPRVGEGFDYSAFEATMQNVDVLEIGNTVLEWADSYESDPTEYDEFRVMGQTMPDFLFRRP